jgi:hypothetical protein
MFTNPQNNKSPVFVHSLFRSGSTYLFNTFRRSDHDKYWCYQEPLHEHLLQLNANQHLGQSEKVANYLRHPELKSPYYHEYQHISDEIPKYFKNEFSYEQYFVSKDDKISQLKEYFGFLSSSAKGRPVFQCCRTTGRVENLKTECGGVHIFLWRTPWNQWWSYKVNNYFDQRNILIASASNVPAFLAELREELQIDPGQLNLLDQETQRNFLFENRLNARRSYKLFYALWCHAFLEARSVCDLAINIDQLSSSELYRENIISVLRSLDVKGIDFSDCEMPKTLYDQSEMHFYNKIEQEVHDLLERHGYSPQDKELLNSLNKERLSLAVRLDAKKNPVLFETLKLRKIVTRYETELSKIKDQKE